MSGNIPEVSFAKAVEEPGYDERNLYAKRSISSSTLLAGQRELVIKHCGEKYYLRITGKGRLILTK